MRPVLRLLRTGAWKAPKTLTAHHIEFAPKLHCLLGPLPEVEAELVHARLVDCLHGLEGQHDALHLGALARPDEGRSLRDRLGGCDFAWGLGHWWVSLCVQLWLLTRILHVAGIVIEKILSARRTFRRRRLRPRDKSVNTSS
ncbi:hypothetical protein DRJ17_07265 [Candidatus Woesearchaeota archaeon]|nr:MAG: hypothetical protein DRJ17_07265 [Candidatus Woesearchaeota archaeon]